MVDVLITVISAVLFVIIFAASIYFLAHYQHPDETNASFFPKIAVVLGLTLSTFNILLIPLDVSSRNSPYGGMPTDILWLMTQLLLSILILFVVPFMYIYYSNSESNKQRKTAIRSGVVFMVVVFLVYSILTIITYLFLGISQIPVTLHTTSLVPASRSATNDSCTECGTTVTQSVQEFKVNFVVYMLGILSFVGWLCLVVFGGIGLVSVPLELLQGFIYRPRPIDKRIWDRSRLKIGERTADLIIQGRSFQERPPKRTVLNKYRTTVYLLQEEFNELKSSFNFRDHSRVVPVLQLIAGILSYGLTLLWILHIVLWNAFGLWPFLNGLFIALDGAVIFFGVLFYSIFAFWLIVCTVRGNFKFALRFPVFFAIHPVQVEQTYLPAFLFNTELIMITSLIIFNLILGYLRVWRWIWYALMWLLIAVAIASFVYLLLRPLDRPRYLHRQQQQQQPQRRRVELQTLQSPQS